MCETCIYYEQCVTSGYADFKSYDSTRCNDYTSNLNSIFNKLYGHKEVY